MENQYLIEAVASLKASNIIIRDAELVEKLGYSKTVVSEYLAGKKKASRKFLQAFAEKFAISLDYLEGRTDAKHIVAKKDDDHLGELIEEIRAAGRRQDKLIGLLEKTTVEGLGRIQKAEEANKLYAALIWQIKDEVYRIRNPNAQPFEDLRLKKKLEELNLM